ncbi:type II toxin-antitoxin system PrlF family antitoxin [Lacimicrobium alkaliphilum]|uniref:Regulator n=1 Tax=Lacimicrobium alkaliphilum TaxID=1526571 RepID=A0A0U2ZFF4_9ALTE|nr:type II toxin-antitoxin system PrlF family antitoxin [Lacimicrobium alkaliphilum]ALS97164.1 regulator [Lacimicrobium alkaliphilum]
MAKAAVVTQSTLTDRFQTTVPATVRKALHLNKRDKLNFTVMDDGKVLVSRADELGTDPVVGQFLSFLEQDMTANPQHIQPLSAERKAHVDGLIDGVEVDLNTPLSDEDE